MNKKAFPLSSWAKGIAFFVPFDKGISRYVGPNHEGVIPPEVAWYGDELSIADALYSAYLNKQKSKDGRYITPPEVAVQMVIALGLRKGMRVLDPCAGIGSLLWQARLTGAEVYGYETDYRAWFVARQMGITLINGDYFTDSDLNHVATPDAVLLTPPFSRGKKYTNLAPKFLKDVAKYHTQVSCLLPDSVPITPEYSVLEKDPLGNQVYAPMIEVAVTRYLLQSLV